MLTQLKKLSDKASFNYPLKTCTLSAMHLVLYILKEVDKVAILPSL